MLMRGQIAAAILAAVFAAAIGAEVALRAQEPALDTSADEAEAGAEAPAAKGTAPARKAAATMGKDKAGIEAYLRHRLAVIKSTHKARVDFVARDSDEWAKFWEKVKEERNLFEVRVARLRLDTFESLGSLDPKDHSRSIADFEQMQNHQAEIFESDQKKKMADFFARRIKKWADYYANQERDRSGFAAEADASWDQLKAAMRLGSTTGASGAKGKYSR